MKYIIAILISIGLLCLACGSGNQDAKKNNPAVDDSSLVEGIHFKYTIQVDNIPLVGPQSEKIDLYLTSGLTRSDGMVEVSVADEIKKIYRSSIINFEDYRRTTLNHEDSTYLTEFYNVNGQKEDNPDSLAADLPKLNKVSITRTDQLEDMAGFGSCRKWTVRTSRAKNIRADSIPALSGSLWIREDDIGRQYVGEYYQVLSKCFHDPDFNGLELWRVLRKLDIRSENLSDILSKIDGVIVKAELVCERYSLGRKVRITVSVNLSDMLEQKLVRGIFTVPEGYEAELVKDQVHQ